MLILKTTFIAHTVYFAHLENVKRNKLHKIRNIWFIKRNKNFSSSELAYFWRIQKHAMKKHPKSPKLTTAGHHHFLWEAWKGELPSRGLWNNISLWEKKWYTLSEAGKLLFLFRKKADAHKKKGIKWTKEKLTWNAKEQWKKAVFSEEFNLDGPDGMQCY